MANESAIIDNQNGTRQTHPFTLWLVAGSSRVSNPRDLSEEKGNLSLTLAANEAIQYRQYGTVHC